MIDELKATVGSNEKILYEGKPHKKCYILKAIIPFFPFALFWAGISFFILVNIINSGKNANMVLFLVLFMLVFMVPVWFYLSFIFLSFRGYKNTTYIITDRAIYVSSGVYTREVITKPFAEISRIDLHRGILDQIFNVGDIIATTNQPNHITIYSLSNYIEIFNLIKKIQADNYADAMYPNAERPSENPGYNTEYKGL